MPSQEQIRSLASEVNRVSEKYQLIHATFAIEKLIEDRLKANIDGEIAVLRAKLINETNKEAQENLFKKVQELRSDSKIKVRIVVDYIPQIQENSARTTCRNNTTFHIVLPKSMENVRDAEGNIDFDRLSRLRKLMAHELGHIVLHTGILCDAENSSDATQETEADYFAMILIELRKQRNAEIYCDKHFEQI